MRLVNLNREYLGRVAIRYEWVLVELGFELLSTVDLSYLDYLIL